MVIKLLCSSSATNYWTVRCGFITDQSSLFVPVYHFFRRIYCEKIYKAGNGGQYYQ